MLRRRSSPGLVVVRRQSLFLSLPLSLLHQPTNRHAHVHPAAETRCWARGRGLERSGRGARVGGSCRQRQGGDGGGSHVDFVSSLDSCSRERKRACDVKTRGERLRRGECGSGERDEAPRRGLRRASNERVDSERALANKGRVGEEIKKNSTSTPRLAFFRL